MLYVKEAFSSKFSKDYIELWSELPPDGLFFLIETKDMLIFRKCLLIIKYHILTCFDNETLSFIVANVSNLKHFMIL